MTVAFDILSDKDFAKIQRTVYEHCGINLHEGKRELVQARLAKLLRKKPGEEPGAYIDRVLQNPDSLDFIELIDNLSTNLTSFFRESEHFDYLAREFLPKFLADKRRNIAGGRRIRAWCAASSTGEEPYSIAMTIQDALDADSSGAGNGGGWDARLLATDISTRVLRVAREAVYDKKRIEPIPSQLRTKYLVECSRGSHQYQPIDVIRRMVCFARLNLIDNWPFTGPLDFIFCRNVMIYFDKPTQQRLIQRFFDILTPGGMLFTGHSESLTGVVHRFRYVQPTIYRKP
jgi:chemotaxis protein methyltransferase CheR